MLRTVLGEDKPVSILQLFFCSQTKKNNSDQTYSCLIERLSSLGIMGPNWGLSWNPPDNHSTIVSRSLRGALNWAPIVPRDSSLSNSRCNFFQSSFLLSHAEFRIFVSCQTEPSRHDCVCNYLLFLKPIRNTFVSLYQHQNCNHNQILSVIK